MAHSGAGAGPRQVGWHPRQVAALGRRLGRALLGASVPALLVIVGVALTRGQVGDPVAWVRAAMATAVVGGGGMQWAFHVAAVTGLAGVWALGFALLVEGYFGLE